MSALRIGINIVLVIACGAAGIFLLGQDAFFLRDRWEPEVGTRFSGLSLYLLASSAFFLAAFAVAITSAWLRGAVPMPPSNDLRPHPAYKGELLIRYWYFLVPALLCLLGAFLLGEKAANPLLE